LRRRPRLRIARRHRPGASEACAGSSDAVRVRFGAIRLDLRRQCHQAKRLGAWGTGFAGIWKMGVDGGKPYGLGTAHCLELEGTIGAQDRCALRKWRCDRLSERLGKNQSRERNRYGLRERARRTGCPHADAPVPRGAVCGDLRGERNRSSAVSRDQVSQPHRPERPHSKRSTSSLLIRSPTDHAPSLMYLYAAGLFADELLCGAVEITL
jgi:hypothetical protein